MKSLSNYLTKIFLMLFIFICGFITYFTFTEWPHAAFFQSILSAPMKYLLIGTGAVLLFLLIRAGADFSSKLPKAADRFLVWIVLGILFLGQLFLILQINQSTFMYDPFRVFDEAYHMLTTHTISGTAMDGYYSIYPNNIPFTILCYWVLKIGSMAGLSEAGLMVFVQVLNALCMDLAILLTVRLLEVFISQNAKRIFLIICLLNPLVYLWPGFFYTSTVSMPFIMGALLLFLKLLHTDSAVQQLKIGGGFGVLLVIGFKIRATVLISLIACLIYFFLTLISEKKAFFAGLKRKLPGFFGLASAILVTFCLCSGIEKHYAKFDTTDTAFPVISWLAMGLEGDGMFNNEDYYATKNAETAEEKKEINTQKFFSRLENLGVSGWLELAGRKLVRTWADGSDDYPSYLNQYAKTTSLHKWILEDNKDILVCYMQMMRCMLFAAAVFGAVCLLIRRNSAVKPVILLQLNLLGGSLFHVLWETGELYSLCFSFLLFALAAVAFDELSVTRQPENAKTIVRTERVLSIAVLLLTAAFFLQFTDNILNTPVKQHRSVISQRTYTNHSGGLTSQEQLKQTFQADQPFNRVCVRVKNSSAEQTASLYQITVADEQGIVYLDTTFTGASVMDYDYLYFALAQEANPVLMTRYTITIQCIEGTEENSVVFLQYDTGNHDAYREGALYKNDIEQAAVDLSFLVYHSGEGSWCRPMIWYSFCSILLLAEIILVWYNYKKKSFQKPKSISTNMI